MQMSEIVFWANQLYEHDEKSAAGRDTSGAGGAQEVSLTNNNDNPQIEDLLQRARLAKEPLGSFFR
jgi:hypothetical protein